MSSPSKATLPTSEEAVDLIINAPDQNCEECVNAQQTTPVPANVIVDAKVEDPTEEIEGKEEAEVEGAAKEELAEKTELPEETKEDNTPPAQVEEDNEGGQKKRTKRKQPKMNGKKAKKAKPTLEITEAEKVAPVDEE